VLHGGKLLKERNIKHAHSSHHHPERLPQAAIALSDDAANHVGRVLRMTAGQAPQLLTAVTRF
jgi:16S rRNA U1498 N3-methylase RsmE